ncbi:sulfurtransferase TusA family protein [Zavarzinella formosa]|uniref:sulfurtransferase TusA family protein n=1 Tax=Zavarzinella formosa TaxID=360055 RepID=UPI0003152E2A|nr:sulfurtransferase TusA family protein [Zavarzinella formosa]
MDWSNQHPFLPEATLDGGDLGWGTGLLMLILRQLGGMTPGQLLEVISINSQSESHLPNWCLQSGHELISQTKTGDTRSYLLCRGRLSDRPEAPTPAMAEPARLVVRRLPPLALLSLGMVHPAADVVPHSPHMEFQQLTTVTVSMNVAVRVEIESLLAQGVQLIRVLLPELGTDPANLALITDQLQMLLHGLPPERLAVELSQPADDGMVGFLSDIPVGNVIVATPASAVDDLQPLRHLSIEKRLALRIDPSESVTDVLTKAIELFGIDRLMVCTHTTDGEDLNTIAEAVGIIRERYGVSGHVVEFIY